MSIPSDPPLAPQTPTPPPPLAGWQPPAGPPPPLSHLTPVAPKKSNKGLWIGLAIGAAVLLVIGLLVIGLIGWGVKVAIDETRKEQAQQAETSLFTPTSGKASFLTIKRWDTVRQQQLRPNVYSSTAVGPTADYIEEPKSRGFGGFGYTLRVDEQVATQQQIQQARDDLLRTDYSTPAPPNDDLTGAGCDTDTAYSLTPQPLNTATSAGFRYQFTCTNRRHQPISGWCAVIFTPAHTHTYLIYDLTDFWSKHPGLQQQLVDSFEVKQ